MEQPIDLRQARRSVALTLRFRAANLTTNDGGWKQWYLDLAEAIEQGQLQIQGKDVLP